ncbi:Gfo/Idh/MocA family protein [Micromonospora sp. NPDC051141]|uniref:Gfo/Idh/MocA family protein n=1 Tax=Micromonospora sp. NPDC051141 TaxID=3364284 RepID=UPI0037ABB49B
MPHPQAAATPDAADRDCRTSEPIRLGLIGCGRWGANVAAAVERSVGARLTAVADVSSETAMRLAARLASVPEVLSPPDMLSETQLDAVLIVTGAASHYELAMAAIRQGKHVFVEKPLAMTTTDSFTLTEAAATAGLILMVGHTFLYSEHVIDVERALREGQVGDLRYVSLQRLAYGRFREDANVIWNLGPHDVSILIRWAGRPPTAVRCVEYMFTRPTISDLAFLTLDFGDFLGHVHLSCIDPEKVRRATVAGTAGGIVYDDVEGAVRLHVNGSRVQPRTLAAGDPRRPLDIELSHFVDCIRTGERPQTDGIHGAMVVAVLEAAAASAALGGDWIDLTLALRKVSIGVDPDRPSGGPSLAAVQRTALV